MSTSLTELHAQLRDLTSRAQDTVKNTNLSAAGVRAELDRLEPEIARVRNAIADGEHIAKERQRIPGLADAAGDTGRGPVSVMGMLGNEAKSQPRIAFDPRDVEAVYQAAITGKSLSIDARNLITSTESPMSDVPDFRFPPVGFRREPSRVADLLPAGSTDRGRVTYFQTTTAATAASVVAPGGTKPESALEYEEVDAPVVKIAHWVEVTDEALSDYARFLTVISEDLLLGLVAHENHQLLLGAGTGSDMEGMLTNGDILTQPKGGDTRLDAILKAIVKLRTGASFAAADGIVIHPNDWQETVLEKDSQLRYLVGDPMDPAVLNLWGLPVKLTTDITEGTALVGAFREAGEVFWRMTPRIDVNAMGEEQFKNNTVLVRCEERLALALYRPTALCEVTGL